MASTNEERFIASCEREGEASVKQKLAAGRYGENRAVWAAKWLDLVESSNSDNTRAEERPLGARTPVNSALRPWLWLILIVLVAGVALIIQFR